MTDHLPCNLEAEQAVLGSLLVAGRKALDDCADLLSPEKFFKHDHGMLYAAIVDFADKGKRIDPITLGDWFASQGMAGLFENGSYLIHLTSTQTSTRGVRAYAEIVAQKALLRRMIDVGAEIANAALKPSGRTPVELAGLAQTLVGGLLSDQPCDVVPIQDAMTEAWNELVDFQDAGGGMDGLASGFVDWDEIVGGFVPGVHYIAARPKMGKSTLAQNIAEIVAIQRGRAVLVVTLEITPKQFAKRMMASQSDVDAGRIRSGKLDDVEWALVSEAQRTIRGAPIYMVKPGSVTPEQLCARIRKKHAETPLACVVLDYLQLLDLTPAYKGENSNQVLTRASRMLSLLGKDLGIPVLALSQLNRGLEDRTDKRPKPSDLRDSGALEQDAETVTFIYRDEVYHPNSPWKNTAELLVALNRHGPMGECRLLTRLDRYRFETLPYGWEPPKAEKASKTKFFGRKEPKDD